MEQEECQRECRNYSRLETRGGGIHPPAYRRSARSRGWQNVATIGVMAAAPRLGGGARHALGSAQRLETGPSELLAQTSFDLGDSLPTVSTATTRKQLGSAPRRPEGVKVLPPVMPALRPPWAYTR